MEITYHLIGFLVCAALIMYAGVKLTLYGDKIADLTGWGKAWVGLILMASVTSLPELITGISSVTFVDAPNLAAGDVFGSCIFNLLILSIIDSRIKNPLTSVVKISHVFAGLFGIILITLSGAAILLKDTQDLFWFSPFSLVIVIVYCVAVWGIFRFETKINGSLELEHEPIVQNRGELRKTLIGYGLNACLVIAGALFLPYFGEHLAEQSNLGNTFFGTVFLAISTSLPELVVSFASIKMKAFDMLVGSLLGSNIFNLFILALDDFFYIKGSLFKNLLPGHMISILAVIVMTAVAGVGIMAKSTKKIWLLSFDTAIIFLIYVLLMVYLYFQ